MGKPLKRRPMTPAQLKRFRFHRETGSTIAEARRLARMTYDQLSDHLRERLQKMSQRKAKQ